MKQTRCSQTNDSSGVAQDDTAGATTTAAPPRANGQTAAPVRTPVDRLPPWKVLLHNDDLSTFEDVVRAIQDLCKLNHIEAVQRMLEAHHQGLALLITTHREHAELLLEQFESKLLTVTIEPEA